MTPTEQFLAANRVRDSFGGASRMWFHRRLAKDGFLKPMFFGGRQRYFRSTDVEKWERARIERALAASGEGSRNACLG